jgi:AraC-like DNA-binding protein
LNAIKSRRGQATLPNPEPFLLDSYFGYLCLAAFCFNFRIQPLGRTTTLIRENAAKVSKGETNRHDLTYQKHDRTLQEGKLMAEPTIATGFANAFLEFAVARGADRQMLMERSGLRPACLTEPDNRIPLATYIALLEAGIELCNEPALALHFGAEVSLSDISIVGAMGAPATAEEGRLKANRYLRLAIDGGDGEAEHRIEFVPEDGNILLKFTSTLFAENPLLTESAFARCVCDGRKMATATGGVTQCPSPKAIRFTHAEPSYRGEYDRIFGLPLEFGSSMNAMVFGQEMLSLQLPQPNQYVSRLVTERAEALLEKLEDSKSMRGRVESLLTPILHTGEARIETIARKLGLSRQTLFRKLKAEGVTFEQVLDELRHRRALEYINGKHVSVNETSYLLGFSDPAAFSRAFKRWTGASPRTARPKNHPQITPITQIQRR